MAGNGTLTYIFATAIGNTPAFELDTNYSELLQTVNALQTFSNYYADSGSVNALSVTIGGNQTVAYQPGVAVQVLVGATNTGPATLNINGLGAQNIVNPNGTPVVAGQLPAGGIVCLMYDGTNFEVIGGGSQTSSSYVAFKSATTVSVSQGTPQTDPAMTIASVPVGWYDFSAFMMFWGTTTGTQGILFAFDAGTATYGVNWLEYESGINGVGSQVAAVQHVNATLIPFGPISAGTGPVDYCKLTGTIQINTPGSVALRWSQNTPSANATSLSAGTRMALNKIG